MTTPVESALAAGRPVIVTDEAGAHGHGQLSMAADAVGTDSVAFFLAHTVGRIGVALPAQRLDALGIPLMVDHSASDAVALSVCPPSAGRTGSPRRSWPTSAVRRVRPLSIHEGEPSRMFSMRTSSPALSRLIGAPGAS